MSKQHGNNHNVILPVAEGVDLVHYGRDKTGAEMFSIWNRNHAFGGIALAWQSRETKRVDYNLLHPEIDGQHLARALPVLAIYAFSRRASLDRLVTQIDANGGKDTAAYRQAIEQAGFRLAEIDNSSITNAYELPRDSLDETGAPRHGFRFPPVRVDVNLEHIINED